MHPVFEYLMKNYHILGILLIVTVIAVKLFMSTSRAKKMLASSLRNDRLDEIIKRLDAIDKKLSEKP